MTGRRQTGERQTGASDRYQTPDPDHGTAPVLLSPEQWWDIYCRRMAEPEPGPIHLGWWFAALLVGLAMLVVMVAGLWTLGRALIAVIQ